MEKQNPEEPRQYRLYEFKTNYSDQDFVAMVKDQTNTSIEQNGGPEIESHKYSQLIFDERAKAVLWKKESNFNTSNPVRLNKIL